MPLPATPDVADLVADAILRTRREKGPMFRDDIAAAARPVILAWGESLKGAVQLTGEPKRVVPRKRNELLDALIEACGGDPAQTGKMAFRAHATALADIKEVCPNLTVDEIKRRAQIYKSKKKDWDLTTTALAKWWADLGGGSTTRAANADIYMEPANWRGVLRSLYGLSAEAVNDKVWLDLGPDTRRAILIKIHQ